MFERVRNWMNSNQARQWRRRMGLKPRNGDIESPIEPPSPPSSRTK